MVVSEHIIQKVKGFFIDKLLVLVVYELVPRLLRMLAKDVVVVVVKGHVVLLDISIEVICAEDFCDLDQLVIVVLTLEEWLLLEDHSCKHAAKRPDVQAVVVILQINQKLWTLEVARSHPHVVFLLRVVKFCETPIDQS